VIAACSVMAALALTAFAVSPALWLSLGLLAMFGFGLIASVASTNTILQTIADEDKRGRVISMYVMTFLGLAPISNFLAGTIAQWAGAHWTLFGCGIALSAATGWFAWNLPSWRAAMRPIYIRQGIIPPPQEQ
jgi:MFS family permease